MKALIVKNEPRTAELATDFCDGFSYSIVPDAAQAMKKMNENRYQLFVLNAAATEPDCLSLVEHIRRHNRPGACHVLVINASEDEKTVQVLIDAGADQVMTGPVQPHHFITGVGNARRLLLLRHSHEGTYARNIELEKDASIGRLLPGIAHEMNNPLGFISSNLTVMADYCRRLDEHIRRGRTDIDPDDSAGTQTNPRAEEDDRPADIDYILSDLFALLDESGQGLERLKKLVRDIQSMAGDDGDHAGVSADININDCLDSALNVLWNELKYTAVVNKSYTEVPLITGPPGPVHRIFLYLFLHLIGSGEGKGEISITTGNKDGHVSVTITGKGCFQHHSNNEKSFSSLRIARTLVQNRSGSLEIKQMGDAGALYRVRLPIQPPAQQQFSNGKGAQS